MDEPSCSQQSCDVGEGLAGTAAEASAWLLLEYPGEWKPKGYEQAQLPLDARTAIDAAVDAAHGLRIQLIRRAERRVADTGLRLFLARGERGHEQLWQFNLANYDALGDLDLRAWALGSDPFEHAHRSEPLFLVCVHGKRDRCCAQKGMPVYRRMSELAPEATWQTTHLGGHRFAATLVCLPRGVCYGRVEESEVERLLAAHARGEIYDLNRYRGRACDAPMVQGGEMLLRQELALTRLDALRPGKVEALGKDKRVTFVDNDNREHTIVVTRETLPAIQQSCDAHDRKSAVRLVALR